MKTQTITDEQAGRKWEIYKRTDNEYYYKYYEFFKSIGWRLTGQSGGQTDGYYYTKATIEWEFEIAVA